MKDKKEFYTAAKVAMLLDVTENTIRAKIRLKELDGYKKLKRWYIFKSDIDKIIRS